MSEAGGGAVLMSEAGGSAVLMSPKRRGDPAPPPEISGTASSIPCPAMCASDRARRIACCRSARLAYAEFPRRIVAK
ncbi:unnamed protein product [Lampetra planeri]